MNIEVLLVQFLVLAFTGALWWLARRDLGSRPPPAPAAPQDDTRELEQLCVTLEALVTDLAGRLEALERGPQGNSGAPPAARPMAPALSVAPAPSVAPMPLLGASPLMPPAPAGEGAAVGAPASPSFPASTPAEPEIAAHAALYALVDAGVTDPAEIARRTGLGRGEVDLILSLRARRAL